MATFSSLIRGDLSPAGEAIDYRRTSAHSPVFADYQLLLLNSGTAALSLAMIAARQSAAGVTDPEVILPAYGCPDLVAAAEYAGLQVVLVDIEPEFPGYNLESLGKAVNKNTVAVTAVNFLGIPERLSEITYLLKEWPKICLIVDNAQYFPEKSLSSRLVGDYIILSFGRGKPISLLGGGALLHRKSISDKSLPIDNAIEPGIGLTIKYWLYNQLLSPFYYQFLSRNPLLRLGETVYKKLKLISRMDNKRQSLLMANIQAYMDRNCHAQQELSDFLQNSSCKILSDITRYVQPQHNRMLRYPTLAHDKKTRDILLEELRRNGLGASSMYKLPLIDIAGVSSRIKNNSDRFPGAQQFADRLITLPVHSGVTDLHLQLIKTLISEQA